MLDSYISALTKTVNQFILIDKTGVVIENESLLFKNAIGKSVKIIHPFFESIDFPLNKLEKELFFRCVNFNFNGEHYMLDITIKMFKNDDNSLIIIDDLTKHYNGLQRVTQIRNETIIKSQLLEYKNQLLNEKERFKNRFIRNFSHEIRIPISTINRMSLRLKNTALSETQHYNLNIVTNINTQVRHIINDILDISRIETNYFEVQISAFNIREVIENITIIYTQKCIEKGITFGCEIDNSCPSFIDGDQYRLTQILTNLIENAIKFTSNGHVKLEVKVSKKSKENILLDFVITDTGIGIKKQDLNAIFKGFYQVMKPQIKNEGIGIGLTIVKHLLQALKGKIKVTSTLNKGTAFSVNLPFVISQNQIIDQKKLEKKKQLENAIKILVADPFSNAKKELESIFNKEEYALSYVESGDAVIESLYRKDYDALIMNVKLPKMDGLDTMHYIRSSEEANFKEIPVILVSANSSKEEEEKSFKNNANAYLSKPYEKRILENKINTLLKNKEN